MRAIIAESFDGIDALKLVEWPALEPGPGQVVIKTHAIGLNYPDLLVIEGKYQVLPKFPFSPGKEAAGVVVRVGASVGNVSVGDKVLVLVEYGAYAEEVLAPAINCYRLPDEINMVDAAALGLVYQTAHFALMERAHYRPGEVVLVTGASGAVGIATVQLAKAFGATVLAGVRGDHQADIARQHGADAIVRLDAPHLREALREQVRSAIGARGVDVLVETVGGDPFEAALRALAWRGRAVVVGFAAGRIPEVKANYLLVKNITVSGLQWSDYRDREPDWVARVQTEILQLWAEGRIKPPITATHPIEEFKEALMIVRSSRAHGKIVLDVANA